MIAFSESATCGNQCLGELGATGVVEAEHVESSSRGVADHQEFGDAIRPVVVDIERFVEQHRTGLERQADSTSDSERWNLRGKLRRVVTVD